MRAATRRIAATTITLALAALVLVGCAVGQNITEYGPDLEKNFVASCKADVRTGNGTTTTIALTNGEDGYCECVYKKLRDSYRLDFNKLKTYEEQVSNAKAGNVPEPPDEVKKSMAECPEKAGAQLPSTTTTTTGS